jgi:phage protein D/phage baseplate assembly protein gpV
MPAQTISNTFRIDVGGQPLPATVDVARVEVEDHLHLPDAFTLTLRDAARTALGAAGAKIGAKVRISVVSDAAATPQKLLEGEVTAVEAELHAGVSYSIVRGYDQSHRLHRGRTTASYLNMTYADVVRKVGQRGGLPVGTVDPTTPTHPHITQANESDWSFLLRLAHDVGYELTVAEGKLHFRKPATSQGAPGAGDLRQDNPLQLLAGSNLLYLRASVTAAEQVDKVEVRGWDAKAKRTLVATAPTQTKAVKNGSSSADVARVFPGPAFVATGLTLATDKDVQQAADATADQVAASQTEMTGEARGNHQLRAGAAVQVGLLGAPFDGQYVITTSRHAYDPDEGYVTWFEISGRQERSTLALTGGTGAGAPTTMRRIDGVVPAVVDDADDPDKHCRVRLKFPWMSDTYVSDWARVASVGAGKDRGLVIVPEVGDEVLVAFAEGDMRRPFVLAGLYNDVDTPDLGPGTFIDGSTKAVNNRLFTSRQGHQLVFVDADGSEAVVVESGDHKLTIRLDQANGKIAITSQGDLELTCDGDLKLEAKGKVSVKGSSVESEAQGSWAAKGSSVKVDGTGSTAITGKPIQLN